MPFFLCAKAGCISAIQGQETHLASFLALKGFLHELLAGKSPELVTHNCTINSPRNFWCWLDLGMLQRPLSLILLQKYRDTNGSRVVIQIGGAYATFCQEEGILLQKYRDKNGRCRAILFKSIGVRGRFDSPDGFEIASNPSRHAEHDDDMVGTLLEPTLSQSALRAMQPPREAAQNRLPSCFSMFQKQLTCSPDLVLVWVCLVPICRFSTFSIFLSAGFHL